MELLVGLLAFLIIVSVLIVALSSFVRRLNRWNRVYDKVNKRYCGQLFRGYLFSKPKLWFNYGRTSARLQNRQGYRFPRKRVTELALNWMDRKLRFEINDAESVKGTVEKIRKWSPRLYPVTTGNEDFDRQFKIQSNQPDVMKKLLTQSVCWQIRQLSAFGRVPQINISLKRSALRITKSGWMTTAESLDDFTRYGLELYDRMQLAECEGIEFKHENDVALVDDVVCPICSEKIVEQMVICLRCKTPHCLDCWQYNGQCATFACDEKRYVRAGGQVPSR